MVIDHSVINPEPFKRVGAFQTSDGQVHATVEDAYRSERVRVIENYLADLKYRSEVIEMDSNRLYYTPLIVREHFEPILKILLDKGLVK